MGMPAPPRLHEDSYAFSMINGILGDGIGSRLGRTVREAGLAYYVGSTYLPLSNRGRIFASVLTSPPALKRALSGLKHELERIGSQPVNQDELRLETASRFGMQELSLMKYSSAARLLLSYASSGLPLDHDIMTMREYGKLTPDSLLRSCSEWLRSGTMYTSIAGGLDGVDA
jgi:predicted Zn-dependent peptidase